VIILAFGMGLFFIGSQPSWASAPRPVEGNMVAVATGVFWALTIIGLRWLGRETTGHAQAPTAATAVACGNLLACLVTLPLALPVAEAAAVDWVVVVFLGFFQIALAYVCLVRGMRRVGALESSLLLLLEPVLNPLWAWLIHGEQPTLWALGGGLIILSATIALAASGRRSASPGETEEKLG
jgi:drug/metabolite transporter (DMT)-like permease